MLRMVGAPALVGVEVRGYPGRDLAEEWVWDSDKSEK